VVAEDHRPGTLFPVRSEGLLELETEPASSFPRRYGTSLGQALFQGTIRDGFIRALAAQPDGVRLLVSVEAQDLKGWRWEWLCGPTDSGGWDFLSLDQRVIYSLYLPSLTSRAYPPIGRRDLRVLIVVANPSDPDAKYGLTSFDVDQNIARLRAIFGELQTSVLARLPGVSGLPTLDTLVTQLTEGSANGPYTILHLVCHGWCNPESGETTLYLEQSNTGPVTGEALPEPVWGSELIERLGRVSRLPYLVFLSVCESAAPEAERRVGGLAQRLVRELGIPAVIGMTERVTVATAHALAEQFYKRLLLPSAKTANNTGQVDRALVEAFAGLAARGDANVPALYSRLAAQSLFSEALDRPLTPTEIETGLRELDNLLLIRAPILRDRLAELIQRLQPIIKVDPATLSAPAKQVREFSLTGVNELCQEVVEISFNALAQGKSSPIYDARQPFRGLSPFRAADREFFFGREALVQKLFEKLSADNFLAVLGPSGSGKSSLVLAGLVPLLKSREPDLQIIDDLTPGNTPLEQLKLRQQKLFFGPTVYVIDQFEELFTLCKDENQRKLFIDKLLTLAKNDRIILTMRADFWGECARYPALKDRMLARQELIGPMTTSELRGAMEQQAAKVGLRFEADLSNTMLDEVAGEPGAMPLLQHALLELWKRRHGRWLRVEEYRAIGGVKKAIAETADRVYNALPVDEQEQMRDIFLRLTRLDESVDQGGEYRNTRRRVSLTDLVPAGSKPEKTKDLVNRLANEALVVTSRNELTGEEEVEVAHEALIRNWKRLLSWLEEDLLGLRLRDSISEAAKEWRQQKEDASLLIHRGTKLVAIREWVNSGRANLTDAELSYVSASLRRVWRRKMLISAVIALVVMGLSAGTYFGTTYGWRPYSEEYSRGPVKIMSLKTTAGPAVMTYDSESGVIWNAADGQKWRSYQGKETAVSFPYLVLERSEFSGSEFFVHFTIMNIETGETTEPELPPILDAITWIDKRFLFMSAHKFLVDDHRDLLIVDLKTAKIIKTFENDVAEVHAVDSDRLLTLNNSEQPPEIWSISQDRVVGQLKLADKWNRTLAIGVQPDMPRVATVQEINEKPPSEEVSPDDLGGEPQGNSTLSVRVWDLQQEIPKLVIGAPINVEDVSEQIVDAAPESGVEYHAAVGLTPKVLGLTVAVRKDPGTDVAVFLYGPHLNLVDKGSAAGSARGLVLSQNNQSLLYLEKPDKSMTLWDVMNGQRFSLPDFFPAPFHHLAASQNGNLLLVERDNSRVELWNLNTSSRVTQLQGVNLKQSFFSLDGSSIAAWQERANLSLWGFLGEPIASLSGITGSEPPTVWWNGCEAIVWTTEGQTLKFAKQWDVLGLVSIRRFWCVPGS
jgi:hypothetical protein